MFDGIRDFFKRFTDPGVSEDEAEGMKHVFDNIDRSFDPGRPRPTDVDENDDEETRRRIWPE